MTILDTKERLRNLVDCIDGDLLRNGLELLAHLVMDLEVAEKIGADRYERTDDRQDYRNGTRSRTWETRVGPVELHIPKLRHSGCQPSFLEPPKRSERALLRVVQEAYINDVSTGRWRTSSGRWGWRSSTRAASPGPAPSCPSRSTSGAAAR